MQPCVTERTVSAITRGQRRSVYTSKLTVCRHPGLVTAVTRYDDSEVSRASVPEIPVKSNYRLRLLIGFLRHCFGSPYTCGIQTSSKLTNGPHRSPAHPRIG
jgi:hypothetical protein